MAVPGFHLIALILDAWPGLYLGCIARASHVRRGDRMQGELEAADGLEAGGLPRATHAQIDIAVWWRLEAGSTHTLH